MLVDKNSKWRSKSKVIWVLGGFFEVFKLVVNCKESVGINMVFYFWGG